jgi:segregation and condensation protein B
MPELKTILEALLLAAGEPLALDRLLALFPDAERPERDALRAALAELAVDYAGRGVELVEVASGFRLQVPQAFAPWVSRLWEERAANYSRALLETLALIAYRQPVTRGEIEAVRGVSASSSIMKTLQERGWIKVIGHREVPGRPALYATTRAFLDYFNLKSLSELPSLAAPRDLDAIGAELERRAGVPPEDSTTRTEPPDG